jgi:hypothetical protein
MKCTSALGTTAVPVYRSEDPFLEDPEVVQSLGLALNQLDRARQISSTGALVHRVIWNFNLSSRLFHFFPESFE